MQQLRNAGIALVMQVPLCSITTGKAVSADKGFPLCLPTKHNIVVSICACL